MPRIRDFITILDPDQYPDSSFLTTIEQYLTGFPTVHDEVTEAVYHQLENLVRARTRSGVELQQSRLSYQEIPTGCRGLDFVLDGGLKRGCVTEIYGSSSTGKTQFCHLIAAEAVSSGFRVSYIDSTNGFCPNRVLDYAQPDMKQARQLLNKIKVFRQHSVYSFLQLIDRIATEMNEMDSETAKPTVIVIDSISGLLLPVMNIKQTQGAALISTVGRGLRCLADKEQICIFLTNHEITSNQAPAGQSRESGHSALGTYWSSQVHFRIAIQDDKMGHKVISNGEHNATLRICEHSIETIEKNVNDI
eukprot:g5729.t1